LVGGEELEGQVWVMKRKNKLVRTLQFEIEIVDKSVFPKFSSLIS
jgi:hypothetical protein